MEKYWQLHIAACQALLELGIRVHVKDRLPLFKLWNEVPKRSVGAKADNVLALIEALLQLRKAGVEPPHKGPRYV